MYFDTATTETEAAGKPEAATVGAINAHFLSRRFL